MGLGKWAAAWLDFVVPLTSTGCRPRGHLVRARRASGREPGGGRHRCSVSTLCSSARAAGLVDAARPQAHMECRSMHSRSQTRCGLPCSMGRSARQPSRSGADAASARHVLSRRPLARDHPDRTGSRAKGRFHDITTHHASSGSIRPRCRALQPDFLHKLPYRRSRVPK